MTSKVKTKDKKENKDKKESKKESIVCDKDKFVLYFD